MWKKEKSEREERRFDYAEDTNRLPLLVDAGQALGPLKDGDGGHHIE